MVAGRDSRRILDRAAQFKTNTVVALLAYGESVTLKERGLMHQAMGLVHHPVNPAFWYQFSGPVLCVATIFPYMRISPL